MNQRFKKVYYGVVPKPMQSMAARYEKFIIYTIIGGFAVLIDIGLFTILSSLYTVHPLIGNVVSTTTAMIYSFLANSFINFKVSDKLLRRFISFTFVTLCGLAASSMMLWLFTDILGVNAVLIKILSLPLVLVIQFSLNKKFTFQPHTSNEKLSGENI